MNKILIASLCGVFIALSTGVSALRTAPALYEAELIFPLESWHN
jgi:hypothetical protein